VIRLAAPLWLSLLAVGVLGAVIWWLRRRWQRLPFPVATVRSGRGSVATVATALSGLLVAAAFVPLSVALARPQEVLARHLERALGVDIAIALDISGSMAALDFRPSDRLGVAKEVIARFLDRRESDRFALVVFARAAVTVCPLTLDHEVATQLLDQASIGMLPDGTAIGLGLGTAVNRLRGSEAPSKVVILVTDGANNAGQLDPLSAADLAQSEKITVHTVLVGSGGEVPIPVVRRDPRTGREVRTIERHTVETNPELLGEIARRTGGSSFRARDANALAAVFARIDALEKTEFTSTKLVRYRERFEPWALAALGMILVAAVVEGAFGRTPW
jgi:Ca-activated chloride channel family protein